jgi:hypothetical protein
VLVFLMRVWSKYRLSDTISTLKQCLIVRGGRGGANLPKLSPSITLRAHTSSKLKQNVKQSPHQTAPWRTLSYS